MKNAVRWSAIGAWPFGKRRATKTRRLPRRRRGRLTREGKAFVLLTIGVGVAAVNTGNNLLYLALGLLLSLLLVSMVLSEVALWGLECSRDLPVRAFAGDPISIEVRLANRKRFMPSYSLEVRDVTDGGTVGGGPCIFIKLGAGDSEVSRYDDTSLRRGYRRWSGFRVTTRYPFGLVEKDHHHLGSDALLVYPALGAMPQALREMASDEPTHAFRMRGGGDEIDGLRDHTAGDEARSVHWRRSASLGVLVVKERTRNSSRRVTLVLDNARPESADTNWDEAFEQAIERAAGFVRDATRRGASVDVVARGGRSPVVTGGGSCDPAWAFLARLESVTEQVPFAAIEQVSRRVAVPLQV